MASRPREMSSSLTVRTSATWSRISANGTAPGRPTAIPSAIVLIRGRGTG